MGSQSTVQLDFRHTLQVCFCPFPLILPVWLLVPDVNMSSLSQQTPVCEKTQLNPLAAAPQLCAHAHTNTHNSKACGARSRSSRWRTVDSRQSTLVFISRYWFWLGAKLWQVGTLVYSGQILRVISLSALGGRALKGLNDQWEDQKERGQFPLTNSKC